MRHSERAGNGRIGNEPLAILSKLKAENDYMEDKESYMIAKGKREKEISKLIKNANETVTEWRKFMEQKITIRNEEQKDWAVVEKITRQAFYNLYVPGCVEHYLVHIMREHEDFIPELDFVLELNGDVIGNIMYTKAKLTDENGCEKIF